MKTLTELRQEYDEIFEIRASELELPEERKTLKTETFVALERELLIKCYEAKKREGVAERVGAKVELPPRIGHKGRTGMRKRRKLSNLKIRRIQQLLILGKTQKQIAKRYGVSQGHLSNIKKEVGLRELSIADL